MTRKVMAARENAPTRRSSRSCGRNGVSALPVLDSGDRVIGVVSEADLLAKEAAAAARRLPVVDRAGHLVGIVSRLDVLGVYARDDHEIQAEITNRILIG